MTLGFKQKFDDGRFTYFVEKIWQSLHDLGLLELNSDAFEKVYLRPYLSSEGALWRGSLDIPIEGILKPKIHTIRYLTDDEVYLWEKEGQYITHVVNEGTMSEYGFAPATPVVSLQEIRFYYSEEWNKYTIFIEEERRVCLEEGFYLKGLRTMEALAQNDGLTTAQFWNWFTPEYIARKESEGKSAYIIHWTDLKY